MSRFYLPSAVIVKREALHPRATALAALYQLHPGGGSRSLEWHMDVVIVTLGGKKLQPCRAIDADDDVHDSLVQAPSNMGVSTLLFSGLVRQQITASGSNGQAGQPRKAGLDHSA